LLADDKSVDAAASNFDKRLLDVRARLEARLRKRCGTSLTNP
jgi:hypothetical protein